MPETATFPLGAVTPVTDGSAVQNRSAVGVSIQGLYKVFGPNPAACLPMVIKGMDKAQLLERTGHVLGLRNIELHMPAGQIQVIMGLSGSGKSTLIRHINRLIDPTAGVVQVGDDDVTVMDQHRLRAFRRERTAMVFQKFALFPHFTVLENTEYGL